MTVLELITELKKMPMKADCFMLQDGEPRAEVDEVYIAKNGRVIIKDLCENAYSNENKPE